MQKITDKIKKRGVLLLLASAWILLSACATTLPTLSDGDVPEAWQSPTTEGAPIWPSLDWWNAFEHDELSFVIQKVKENNFDLANNRRNLESAWLTLTDAKLDLWPTPDVSATESRSRQIWEDGSASDNSFSAQASLTYNNLLSKPTEHSRSLAEYDNTIANAVDTALNTLNTAAAAYFNILLIRDQIADAEQNLANAQAIMQIAQAKVNAGTSTPIDALQQSIAVENQRTTIRNLRQQELSARATLALLVGQHVSSFNVEERTLESLSIPKVQPGIPADLLRRRPDLVRAEANLRSSRADVDLALLTFLPNISLTASTNTSSHSLSDWLDEPITLSASLIQAFIDNGQRLRNTKRARLRLESALADYRKTTIKAFNDIEVALSNIALLDDLAAVRADDLARAQEAFRIAQVRYRSGVINYETVLNTQNSLFSTRSSYLSNLRDRLNAAVDFYQALGGGWQMGDESSLQKILQ